MKRLFIYSIFLAGLLTSCGEDELGMYSLLKDSLQFYQSDSDDTSGTSSELEQEINFAELTYEEDDEVLYYGDNKEDYTFSKIIMQLQGFPSPDERPYKLKVVSLDDEHEASELPEVVFESYYSLQPDCMRDTISFTVKRPKQRGTYKLGIMVDVDADNSFFDKGVVEQSVLELTIKDVYTEPTDWQYRTKWLGDFSEEKYAFMVTATKNRFTRNDATMWENTNTFIQDLMAKLETEEYQRYKDAGVSFPGVNEPVWWEAQVDLLGEYSDKNYNWMKGIVEGQGLTFGPGELLVYWNLMFREWDYSGEYNVPEYKGQVSWWRTSELGPWSISAQNFVVKTLYQDNKQPITESVWAYANVLLRDRLPDYKEWTDPSIVIDLPVAGEPEWWGGRVKDFGSYSSVKRDLIVMAVLNSSKEDANIDVLVDASKDITSYLPAIVEAVNDYNREHEDSPLDFPDYSNVAPTWWDAAYLGDYSKEKETFIRAALVDYGRGESSYYQGMTWANWDLILNYEQVKYPEYKDLVIPMVTQQPAYWQNGEVPYLGEYSVAKHVFVWMKLLPKNWGNVDGWYLGASSEWGYPSSWPGVYKTLTEEYAKDYENFMNTYKDMNPEPFTFPEWDESWGKLN